MSSVRRWYVYLVSAISLQAATWAVIALLRNLALSRLNPPPTAIAFEIAVIVIGLPVYLVHWLWGQRLAGRADEERQAVLRHLYLYGTLAGFLGPFATNTFDLIGSLLQVKSTLDRQPSNLTSGNAVVYHMLALLVLGALWFYHKRTVSIESPGIPERGGVPTVRRLYVLGFSASGLTMTIIAIINLLRWLMAQFGVQQISTSLLGVGLTAEITRLIVGLPLWLVFWLWAGRLFNGPSEAERESALRKFYLYGAVSVGAMGAITSATAILASLFRSILGLPSSGDIRVQISIILGMGVLWAYHAWVIRGDAAQAGEAPRQAGVRRLYAYLIAGIGLAALLVGLGGDVSVIIRSLDQSFGSELRVQLSWFTAAIIAGLPVWILPWRQLQGPAGEPGAGGADARRSLVRRIYLYVFLFVATMTVLSGSVFVLYKVLSWALGADAPTWNVLGHAIAFSLIAVGVWLYHGATLRGDTRLSNREEARQLAAVRVTIVDAGDGAFGRALMDALQRKARGLEPVLLDGSGAAVAAGGEGTASLAAAELIVCPWTVLLPEGAGQGASPEIAQAVVDSPARKLLIPTRPEGWEWAGLDRWDRQDLIQQTVHAIEQMVSGDPVQPARPLSAGTIVLIVIGVLIALSVLSSAIGAIFDLM